MYEETNIAWVIKDVDTGEYLTRLDGVQFADDLSFVGLYLEKHLAELRLIKGDFIRWEDGYRVPRKLKAVKIRLAEIDD